MKRMLAMLLTLVLCMGIAIPAHAGISYDAFFSGFSEDELVSVVEAAAKMLKPYGYSIVIQKDNTTNENTESVASNDEYGKIDTNEVITEPVTAEMFVADLAAGWEARMDRVAKDEARSDLMSDKQYIEYMSEAISAEYDYINKYRDAEFEDANLKKYFQDYISALDEQYIAITEYYGKDDILYNQYWSNGIYKRFQVMYWINRKWGMDVKKEYQKDFADYLFVGRVWDIKVSVENDLFSQLTKMKYSLVDASKYSVYISPITITNNTSYQIQHLSVKANLLDKNGNKVDTAYLVTENNVASGKTVSGSRYGVTTNFDRLSFTCSYTISDGVSYYEQFEFDVTPQIQYGWNGVVTKNGAIAEGQPVYTIEDLRTSWEMNSSWSKKLYVPVIKFSVKNTGTVSGDDITVHVVFKNDDTKEVWDEETVYVIGSSDSPLEPGYSKKAFAYSSVGYSNKTTILPNLTADIYVNDVLVKTVKIQK